MNDLGCSCIIDDDSGTVCDWVKHRIRRARLSHVCCECGGAIAKGEQYEYVGGVWEGDFCTFKTCMPCLRIRDDYFCSWVYGQMRHSLKESLGLDYVTGEEQDESARD